MSGYIFNGQEFTADELPAMDVSTGVSETMLVWKGSVVRLKRHQERAVYGLDILNVKHDIKYIFYTVIQDFIQLKNIDHGRLRVQFFLSAIQHAWGGVHYLISLADAPEHIYNDTVGHSKLVTYGRHRKPFGPSQNVKLNERTLYNIARDYAVSKAADDALIFNEAGRPIESAISSLWWRKGETWFTPPLSEGPVAGTVRAALLEESPFNTRETSITLHGLYLADEIMLTNAIRGVRPVNQIDDKLFAVSASMEIAEWLRRQ